MSVFQCPGCGYRYDEILGDDFEGYPPNTPFDSLPDDFVCPDCAVREKIEFVELSEVEEI